MLWRYESIQVVVVSVLHSLLQVHLQLLLVLHIIDTSNLFCSLHHFVSSSRTLQTALPKETVFASIITKCRFYVFAWSVDTSLRITYFAIASTSNKFLTSNRLYIVLDPPTRRITSLSTTATGGALFCTVFATAARKWWIWASLREKSINSVWCRCCASKMFRCTIRCRCCVTHSFTTPRRTSFWYKWSWALLLDNSFMFLQLFKLKTYLPHLFLTFFGLFAYSASLWPDIFDQILLTSKGIEIFC